MQKIVSKYALAAHLAILAVAPLFLLPFVSQGAAATVILWLSFFAFVWVLMEPSRRRNEMPHDARARVAKAVLSDPLYWFSAVFVCYAGIRAFNGGVGMSYDAELMTWTLRHPTMSMMPGCVAGAGYLPFAVAVALAVVFQGVRHALGRSARAAFLLIGSLASASAALVLAFAMSYRHAGVMALANGSTESATYFGTAFGIQLLVGLVALFLTVEHHWMKAEPLAALGLIGNAVGLFVFAPAFTVAVFGIAFLLLAVVSFALVRHVFEGSGSFRCAIVILVAIVVPVLYGMVSMDIVGMAEKFEAFREYRPFPGGIGDLRDTLSAIALKTWRSNPWLGTGLGSFALDIRFMATSADWAVVPPSQVTTLNGWWLLLAERGVIGAMVWAVALGMLTWTYVSRCIASFPSVRFAPEHLLGPVVLMALVALAFFNCSYLRPEVMLLAGAVLALSGGAFPVRVKGSAEEKDN